MHKIYFRADGNPSIGMGHIIRSLALAGMLKDTFSCHFITRTPSELIEKEILKTCISVLPIPSRENDLEEAKSLATSHVPSGSIVVLDGYHFRTEYQQVFKDHGCKVVSIDDIFDTHFVSDVIINHAGGTKQQSYSAEGYTTFCLGLKYALLRRPFRLAAKDKIIRSTDNNILICLGGADPKNDTLEVLKFLDQLAIKNQCFVIVGSANPHLKSLRTFVEQSNLNVQFFQSISAKEMVHYMKISGCAITSPSSVSFEYLSVGGTLYLKTIADNQRSIKSFFLKNGLAFDLEEFPVPASAQALARKKQDVLFDGRIKERFNGIFNGLIE